jgi:hypothetical protein
MGKAMRAREWLARKFRFRRNFAPAVGEMCVYWH